MKTEQGITLVELVVTLSIASILIAIAVPSYRNLVASNRLSTTANDYIASLADARLEAIRRNVPMQFCGSSGNTTSEDDTLGGGCGSAIGQVVTLDEDGEAAVAVRAKPGVSPELQLGSVTALRFGGQGQARKVGETGPYNGLVVDLGSDQVSGANRRCVYMITGSTLVTCAVTAEECPDEEPDDCQ